MVDPPCSITKLQNDVYIILNNYILMSCKIMCIIKIHDTFKFFNQIQALLWKKDNIFDTKYKNWGKFIYRHKSGDAHALKPNIYTMFMHTFFAII